MTNSLDEDGIARLIRDNEGQHTLAPEQRERLRARLGHPDHAAGPSADVLPIGTRSEDVAAPKRPVGRRLALAAATLLVVAAAAAAYRSAGDTNNDSIDAAASATADTDTDTATVSSTTACSTALEALIEGAVVWSGVETWSRVTDDRAPEPDLLALAHTASLTEPQLSGLTAELDGFLDARRLRLAAYDGAPGATSADSSERRAVESAVTRALAEATERCNGS